MEDIDIASYAEGNTPYCISGVPYAVKMTLKTASMNFFQWFYNNGIKVNIGVCHFLSSLDINSKMTIENFSIQNQTLKNFYES